MINGISGLFGLEVIKDLGNLVNLTYDKALMSGNFAQAVKFDFSQVDLEFRAALLSQSEKEMSAHLKKVEKARQTLSEDLAIVEERALGPKASELILDIKVQLQTVDSLREDLITKKRSLLSHQQNMSDGNNLERFWESHPDQRKTLRKLTALNDDAAVVGYQFRLDSEAKNTKNLKLSFWILGICVLVSLLLSFLVSYLIINPLLALQNICKKVSLGDYSVRSDYQSKDELGTLASSFNSMLNTINDKTENISSLLTSLPFGLFYFDQKGFISQERSNSTDLIFPNFSQYTTLSDFFSDNLQQVSLIEDILKAMFQKIIPFNSAADLLPSTLEVMRSGEHRTIQLSYKPKFGPKKKVERVILLAEDVTDKIRALAKSRELTERVERVSSVSTDIEGFKEFLLAVDKLYQSMLKVLETYSSAQLPALKRDLHSLKGLLGIYSYTTCASGIHEIESVVDSELPDKKTDFINRLKKSQELFKNQSDDISKLLALNSDTGLKYYNSNKLSTVLKLVSEANNSRLFQAMADLDRFPIEKVFVKYTNFAATVASKLEDKKVKILFENSDDVSFEEVQRLDLVFVHVLNNSIDHGVESSQERIALNKAATGEIKISGHRHSDDSLEFRISDDGKGINGDYLLEKAVRMGITNQDKALRMTQEEKVNLIFASGLSSKDTTSDVSGRGVGMDAVKAYIESLGGSIKIVTKLGQGTTFIFHVPALKLPLKN